MKPVVLIILDGWGVNPNMLGNAIAAAQKPTFDFIEKYFPFTLLQSSGITVGLPWGEPGNSEVGHIAIGTGQIWHQPLTRITLAIQDKTFFQNDVLKKAAAHAKANNSAWHIIGLVGSGSVHSYIDHLYALIEVAKTENINQVWLHLSTDGQDSPPKEGAIMIQNLIERLAWVGVGKISSIIGRFYSMDRDYHWERIEKAYKLITEGIGEKTTDFVSVLKKQYGQDITDNFIGPLIAVDEQGNPQGAIQDNDVVIFFNFREDRARELTKTLAMPGFKEFQTKPLKNLFVATMTQYESTLPTEVIFPPIPIKHTLSELLSHNNKTQFKIAETEKYAHITYFFNGGKEEMLPGEERSLMHSFATSHFNEVPEMKALEIGDGLISAIASKKYDFLMANFANADMLGHTGDYKAVVKGVEVVDGVVSNIMKTVLEQDGVLVITADHGNGEQMVNTLSGEIYTEHTSNPIPFYLIMNSLKKEKTLEQIQEIKTSANGLIIDVAATILDLMGIMIPADMDSKSLLPLLYQQ